MKSSSALLPVSVSASHTVCSWLDDLRGRRLTPALAVTPAARRVRSPLGSGYEQLTNVYFYMRNMKMSRLFDCVGETCFSAGSSLGGPAAHLVN